MEEPIATPKPLAPTFRATSRTSANDQILSSSPAFGTPAYPIQPRVAKPPQPFAQQIAISNAQAVLPILLPPQTLRPVAFRTLTKKHNLTLTSSGLSALATFIGKSCGSGWREEGLAERILDELAKQWKRDNGGLIVDDGADKKLKNILKSLESCMSGGRLDTGKLSRRNTVNGTLSRQTSLAIRPDVSREDSQNSLGMSKMDVQDKDEADDADGDEIHHRDARVHMKVISAMKQPRLTYSTTKKTLEVLSTPPSLLPPIQHKIAMLRNRYQLVHQRLLRNESFQTPSFSTTINRPKLISSASDVASMQQAYKITPISNLLGRSGSSHLLLGLLVHSAAGDLSVTDLSGSVVLDMAMARPVPEDGAWFCPGMFVLVEGTYDEDGSNSINLGGASGVGGQIKGRFVADTIAGPPAERREVTLGVGHNHKADSAYHVAGAGYGWIDFLGVGSEKAIGSQMRRTQRRLLGRGDSAVLDDDPKRSKIFMIGECNLDSPRTVEAIRAILSATTATGDVADRPLSIVFMGNFVSAASMACSPKGGGSIEYKEHFDSLASVLSEFPSLLSTTTFVFVPGDNDPWASSFSAGAATLLPKQSIPELFTSRIRRVIVNANSEARLKENEIPGEAIFTSNPARISLFGPVEEIVLFRDDITGRLRRNAVMFTKPAEEEDDEIEGTRPEEDVSNTSQPVHDVETEAQEDHAMALDPDVETATSHRPQPTTTTTTTNSSNATNPTPASLQTARKLVKTLLDQSHLSPFPISTRPVLWDFASSLNLYPLPTALVLADSQTPAFTLTYEGCHVMNPGRVLDDMGARKGIAKWIEYDVTTRKGCVRDVRF